MDPAYISAIAALAGSAIGGLTSLAASWLTQRAQLRAQQLVHQIGTREQLYRDFLEEAAKLYADAFEHSEVDISKLVPLYTLVSRMRLLSSARTLTSAERVATVIIETYLGPNRTFRDLREILQTDAIETLKTFGEACREELQTQDLLVRASGHVPSSRLAS